MIQGRFPVPVSNLPGPLACLAASLEKAWKSVPRWVILICHHNLTIEDVKFSTCQSLHINMCYWRIYQQLEIDLIAGRGGFLSTYECRWSHSQGNFNIIDSAISSDVPDAIRLLRSLQNLASLLQNQLGYDCILGRVWRDPIRASRGCITVPPEGWKDHSVQVHHISQAGLSLETSGE